MFGGLFKNIHWTLVLSTLALCAVGVVFIYSASYYESGNYAAKQLVWTGIGLLVFMITAHVSYRSLMGASYLIYAISVLLLLAVFVVGQVRSGAQRWLDFGIFAVQPSEFAKLATMMAVANFLGTYHHWESGQKVLWPAAAMIVVPMLLIMNQPDLGTSLLFIPMMLVVFFLWGIRYRYVFMAAGAGVLGVPILWNFLKEYQRNRIMVFLNPDRDPLGAGYTAIQSRIAVGSGGLWGKGLLQGTQGQLDFVPEHHTDFIFCVIGEEWGFAGAVFLLLCYMLLFGSILKVILSTTDMRAKLLAAGICSVLFFQVFVNIGMSIGIMPITGLTLPLVSYGGSSFVVTAFALGLILSIYRERSIF